MFPTLTPRLRAILQGLFVAFLWSTSWIFIRIGLHDIPPLTFAGLRYGVAFLCLLPFFYAPARRSKLRALTHRQWLDLVILGVLFYTITQGAVFIGLANLPTATVNLILSFTSVIIALVGIAWLAERPTAWQWVGIALAMAGVVVFFYPVAFPATQLLGLAAVSVGLLANAGSQLLGRRLNREGAMDPLLITTVSIGAGAVLLLVIDWLTQGLPHLQPVHWAMIVWLAVVNTAFAFTLWNGVQRILPAMESSMINNTMLIQVPILAWICLGEGISYQGVAGLIIAGLGTLVVQLNRRA